MRIDNSAWGSRDFVEKIASRREMTEDEAVRLLKARIEEIKKSGDTLKYLYIALQDAMQKASQTMTTLTAISRAMHDTLMSIIRNLR